MNGKLELMIDGKAVLGEGPSWDPDDQLLFWVDIIQHKVYIHDCKNGKNSTIDVGQDVGCIVPRQAGGAVIALQHGIYFLDLITENITLVADPESSLPANRFNDGKCDCAGRFWAGTLCMDQNDKMAKNAGTLYCMDTNLDVRAVLEGITISNGITWSPDNKIMYFIDTPKMQVEAFDFDSGSGNISNRRIVLTISEGEGAPDGMTTDAEGMIWVAQWGGYCISRWNPYTGELLDKIMLPCPGVTSCVFGGPDLDELYITTSRSGGDDESAAGKDHSGGVFKIKPGVKGVGTYKFKG